MKYCSAMLLAFLCSAVLAQQPSIEATPQVRLGDWVDIRVAVPDAAPHCVRVRQIRDGLDRDYDQLGDKPLLLSLGAGRWAYTSPEEGRYVAELAYLADGKIAFAAAEFSIGNAPTPIPQPGRRLVLILRETADATPAEARLITTLRTGRYAEYWARHQHIVLFLDKDYPSAALRPYIEAAKQFPALVIADTQDPQQVLYQGPLPANPEEILRLVKEYGG